MNFKGIVKGKNASEVSRTGNSNSGIVVEASDLLNKVKVEMYDGVWISREREAITYCRISLENHQHSVVLYDDEVGKLWGSKMKRRKFRVLGSSNLGFGVRFDGMILDYLCEGTVPGTVTLQQPARDINGKHCVGTVTFDKKSVEEIVHIYNKFENILHALKRLVNGIPDEYDDLHTKNLIENARQAIRDAEDDLTDFDFLDTIGEPPIEIHISDETENQEKEGKI